MFYLHSYVKESEMAEKQRTRKVHVIMWTSETDDIHGDSVHPIAALTKKAEAETFCKTWAFFEFVSVPLGDLKMLKEIVKRL